MPDKNDHAERPPHHSSGAGAPGASGPGEPGYDGNVTIGDDGAHAGMASPGADTTPAQDRRMAEAAERAQRAADRG